MATKNIVRFSTAKEFFRIFSGIYADVYRQIQAYNNLKSTDEPAAIEHLKTAIAKPHFVRARALEFVSNYSQEELETCMAIITDGVTLSEINTELNSMVIYCTTLKESIESESITWDNAANNMFSHFEDIMPKIAFPIPNGYTDIWGR